jgi:hypothetical protein
VVRVETYSSAQGWVQRGADFAATFANGDTLRAIARSNGMVDVYKNTTLLGSRDTSAWTYHGNGGYLGISIIGGPNAFLDDFGGGTYTGASVPDALAVDSQPGADRASVRPERMTSNPYPSHEEMAAAPAPSTAAAQPARLTEAQALVAQADAWHADYQRVLGLAPARPAGCKPLCDLLAAPLGHTPVSLQPGERV